MPQAQQLASTGDQYSSAVRIGDWKPIRFPRAQDLAAEQPQKRDELLAVLNAWLQDVGAAPARSRPAREARPVKAPDTPESVNKESS